MPHLTDKQIAELKAKRIAEAEETRRKRNAEAAVANEQHRRNKDAARKREGARVVLPALDGCVMVVSDQHYMPGHPPSAAHLASVLLAKKLKPWAVIANGDAIDGACIRSEEHTS